MLKLIVAFLCVYFNLVFFGVKPEVVFSQYNVLSINVDFRISCLGNTLMLVFSQINKIFETVLDDNFFSQVLHIHVGFSDIDPKTVRV